MTRTAASRPYATRAIVLRVRPLGEKDRIVTLLTPDHGKRSAVARGARGPRASLAAVSQPFTLARLLLAHGRQLDVLTQAQIEESHGAIAGDLLKMAWGSYLCELCDAVPEDQPDPFLFEILTVALGHLDACSRSRETVDLVGHWFEARFLAHLGYAPTLGRCVGCGVRVTVPAHETESPQAFSPGLGGTLCRRCAARDAQRIEVPVEALRVLHRLERAPAPPSDPQQAPLLSRAARAGLRECLRRCLVEHLEVRLKSARFLDEMRSSAALEPAMVPNAV